MERTEPETRTGALVKLVKVLAALTSDADHECVSLSVLKQGMVASYPTFAEKSIGFPRFLAFAEFAQDQGLLSIQKKENDIFVAPADHPPTEPAALSSIAGTAVDDFEQSLQRLSALTNSAERLRELRRFAAAVASIAGCPDDELLDASDPIAQLIRLPVGVLSTVGAALVRLLVTQRQNLDLRAFVAIDQACAPLYHRTKTSPGSQTYIKVQMLNDTMARVDSAYARAADLFLSVPDLPNGTQALLKTLNSVECRTLANPFLPEPLRSPSPLLREVCRALVDYAKTEPQEHANALAGVLAQLRRVQEIAAPQGGTFAGHLVHLSKHLAALVNKHFEASPTAQLPSLSITNTGKRYALGAEDSRLLLSFELINTGPGHAFDLSVQIESDSTLELQTDLLWIGTLPVAAIVLDFPARTAASASEADVLATIKWRDAKGQQYATESLIQVEAQRTSISWDLLKNANPYHLNPIRYVDEFVGWTSRLEKLVSCFMKDTPGSCFVHGPKRLGKTSLSLAMMDHFKENKTSNHTALYVMSGRYRGLSYESTLKSLTRSIIDNLRITRPELEVLPVFDLQAIELSPIHRLSAFFDNIARVMPHERFVLVLDEFDEIPDDLLVEEYISRPFLLALRDLSERPNLGLALVGGERMREITTSSILNKFETIVVTPFTRDHHWGDFCNFVRQPSPDLDIDDVALVRLWSLTRGHPYFTRMVCSAMFEDMVARRDSHVMPRDIERAFETAAQSAQANAFAHFWEDGIVTGVSAEASSAKKAVETARRKLFGAAALLLRSGIPLTEPELVKATGSLGVPAVAAEAHLKECIERGIFATNASALGFCAPLFERWLRGPGYDQLSGSFRRVDLQVASQWGEHGAYIRPEEIAGLVDRWGGLYRGRPITEDRIRAWLKQFGDNSSQRAMFSLLNGITFYHSGLIWDKIGIAHRLVTSAVVKPSTASAMHPTQTEGRRREDIILTYGDSVGKSGAALARIYAQKNRIYSKNVVERTLLSTRLADLAPRKSCVVCVDDFLGTGGTARAGLDGILALMPKSDRGIKVFFIAISGFGSVVDAVEAELNPRTDLDVRVHVVDSLGEEQRCFSEQNPLWIDSATREHAKRLCIDFGEKLVPEAVLGYGGSEALVVFDGNCPNNVPAVLWSERKDWIPLFPRA